MTQLVEDRPEFPSALEQGRVGSVLNSGGAEKTNKLQSAALAHSKVPLLFGYDVIHGYRTIFPIPLAIASSWDPSLAELSAHTGAVEARAEGIRWTFAPMVDIARDARWGRIAEGAGEDPVLGAAMAAAYVRGFQGAHVLACAKHYAAYGAAEAGRDYNSAEMSERTLREVYLPPFHAAVDAGVATLMSAFESLNGAPATANKHLLDDILRPPVFFLHSAEAPRVLRELQARKSGLAFVVDEHGELLGLLTMEDVIEELVGEIVTEDETREEMLVREEGGAARVRGDALVREVNRKLPASLPEDDRWSTVAGLCIGLAGRIPQKGVCLKTDAGWQIEVLDASPRRVRLVRIAREDDAGSGQAVRDPDEAAARPRSRQKA